MIEVRQRFPEVPIFSAMTSHKSLIAFQKRDGNTSISLHTTLAATLRDSMRRTKPMNALTYRKWAWQPKIFECAHLCASG